jgi:hypothetical protein
VALSREEIDEFRAQPARGKVREAAHVVQRLVSRAGSYDAIHRRSLRDGDCR